MTLTLYNPYRSHNLHPKPVVAKRGCAASDTNLLNSPQRPFRPQSVSFSQQKVAGNFHENEVSSCLLKPFTLDITRVIIKKKKNDRITSDTRQRGETLIAEHHLLQQLPTYGGKLTTGTCVPPGSIGTSSRDHIRTRPNHIRHQTTGEPSPPSIQFSYFCQHAVASIHGYTLAYMYV